VSVKVFYIEETNNFKVYLRRYTFSDDTSPKCPLNGWGHDASVLINQDIHIPESPASGDNWPHEDERFPKVCGCGYIFKNEDKWQVRYERLYYSKDHDKSYTLYEDLPVGACWNADWMLPLLGGKMPYDSRYLCVKCPNGCEWAIDGRASNCTRKDDNTHFCWVRHGKPEDGTLHVDKNGDTCDAGAGSIICGDWHGFLHNGHLVLC
jgi:hypothetical protein